MRHPERPGFREILGAIQRRHKRVEERLQPPVFSADSTYDPYKDIKIDVAEVTPSGQLKLPGMPKPSFSPAEKGTNID